MLQGVDDIDQIAKSQPVLPKRLEPAGSGVRAGRRFQYRAGIGVLQLDLNQVLARWGGIRFHGNRGNSHANTKEHGFKASNCFGMPRSRQTAAACLPPTGKSTGPKSDYSGRMQNAVWLPGTPLILVSPLASTLI